MRTPTGIRRSIIVVLDGLRPDAIERFDLAHMRRLMQIGASSHTAATVVPSLTASAMTSLMTGMSPARHGITSDRLFIPRVAAGISPLPELLAKAGLPASAFLAGLPPVLRGIGARIGLRFGFGVTRFAGQSADEILLAAGATVRTQRRGLIVFHWPDADRAGHESGWMSPAYAMACRRLDETLGTLVSLSNVETDSTTMLTVLADHGGGGVVSTDHESSHYLDRTIPLVFVGPRIRRTELVDAQLIDVPATVLYALGLEVPPSFEGQIHLDAFAALREAAVA